MAATRALNTYAITVEQIRFDGFSRSDFTIALLSQDGTAHQLLPITGGSDGG